MTRGSEQQKTKKYGKRLCQKNRKPNSHHDDSKCSHFSRDQKQCSNDVWAGTNKASIRRLLGGRKEDEEGQALQERCLDRMRIRGCETAQAFQCLFLTSTTVLHSVLKSILPDEQELNSLTKSFFRVATPSLMSVGQLSDCVADPFLSVMSCHVMSLSTL